MLAASPCELSGDWFRAHRENLAGVVETFDVRRRPGADDQFLAVQLTEMKLREERLHRFLDSEARSRWNRFKSLGRNCWLRPLKMQEGSDEAALHCKSTGNVVWPIVVLSGEVEYISSIGKDWWRYGCNCDGGGCRLGSVARRSSGNRHCCRSRNHAWRRIGCRSTTGSRCRIERATLRASAGNSPGNPSIIGVIAYRRGYARSRIDHH